MARRGLFVGLTTVDIQYLVDAFPEPDTKTAAREFLMSTGGPAANAAVTFAHLGGDARLLTRVGDHAFAPFMREDLDRYGVEVVDVAPDATDLPTVSSVVSSPATQERTIITYRPVSRLPIDDRLIASALDGVEVVLLDGHHPNVASAVASEARRRGIPVVLDGGSWKEGTEDLLPCVDIAICSEAFHPPGTRSVEEVFADLAGRRIERCAVTMGGRAIRYHDGDASGEIPVTPVAVVDTSGAGDIFPGAFCHWHATGADFPAALARAAEVATRSCRYFGAREWMRHDPPR